MKRLASAVLAAVLVLSLLQLAACVPQIVSSSAAPTLPGAEGSSAGQSPSQTAEDTPAVGVMSETARSLGITQENYPRIDGSTSTFGINWTVWRTMHNPEWEEYDSEAPQEASKTVPSYHKLIEGDVDMILVPYASEDVLKAAREAGVELEFHKIAAEALVFITPAENTAENITREQVRSIYLDYGIRSWKELGGPDRELVPICRNADSGSQSQMDNLVLDNEPMHPDIQKNYVELTMEGMLELTAFYHNGGLGGSPTDTYALGYTLYTYLKNMTEATGVGDYLKILSYDGIAADEQSIKDGSYPLSDGYYAVVRSDLAQDHSARAVISWLQSGEGADAIEGLGLIPCA